MKVNAGQQTLLAAGTTTSGTTSISFGNAFTNNPKVLLGIAGIESSVSTTFSFDLSVLSTANDHFIVKFTIGNETNISTLRVSYLAVQPLFQDIWITGSEQMQTLTSCRLLIYLVAPIASGKGVRNVTVTFNYLAQTGKNITPNSKILTFTQGVAMTSSSGYGYWITPVLVDS